MNEGHRGTPGCAVVHEGADVEWRHAAGERHEQLVDGQRRQRCRGVHGAPVRWMRTLREIGCDPAVLMVNSGLTSPSPVRLPASRGMGPASTFRRKPAQVTGARAPDGAGGRPCRAMVMVFLRIAWFGTRAMIPCEPVSAWSSICSSNCSRRSGALYQIVRGAYRRLRPPCQHLLVGVDTRPALPGRSICSLGVPCRGVSRRINGKSTVLKPSPTPVPVMPPRSRQRPHACLPETRTDASL